MRFLPSSKVLGSYVIRHGSHLAIALALLLLLVALVSLVGCQLPKSQSPNLPTDKRVIVQIEGSKNVTVIIHYHQTTTAELGGGNSTSTELKQSGELKFPLIGP